MFKKLFTSDIFFLVSVALTVISVVPFTICSLMVWPQYSYMPAILVVNAISVVALYISYKRYNKNVMKSLIGFLLMGVLAITITATFPIEPGDIVYTILSLINLLVVVSLCINHFVINSNRYAKSLNIYLNQILLFAQFAIYLIMAYRWIGDVSGFILVLYMLGIPFAEFGVTASIVCVESRLDAYKYDREVAGWTEEAGYPKGYVHQKDRNK